MDKKIYRHYFYSYPHKSTYIPVESDLIYTQIKQNQNQNFDLYLHIPFCSTKCGYCNLFSIVKGDKLLNIYVNALIRHIKQVAKHFPNVNWQSITFGGGTPILLSVKQMHLIMESLKTELGIDYESISSTIEVAPRDCTPEKIECLLKFNFKRVSIGVQSFNDEELHNLIRNHRVNDVISALELLKDKFPVLNVDIIYGIKDQTKNSLIDTLNKILKFRVNEIFLYPLYVQPNTKLNNIYKVNEDKQLTLYKAAADFLHQHGFSQTSMRRFSKFENKIASCNFNNCIAVGCGGRSYINELHFCEPYAESNNECVSIIEKYIEKEDFFTDLVGAFLTPEELKHRYVIHNLLSTAGMDLNEYKKLFDSVVLKDFPILRQYILNRTLFIKDNKIKLSFLGIAFSDKIGVELMSKDLRTKMNL